MRALRLLAALTLCLALALPAYAGGPGRETLFQVSLLDALLAGDYYGSMNLGQLTKHGDTGLGTFQDLDGEMVVSGGVVYRVDMQGKPHVMPPKALTPFAQVTYFDSDMILSPPAGLDFPGLKKWLTERLPSQNLFYAVRVKGSFSQIKARSVPAQKPPYPPLLEVVKHQAVFNWQDVEGELVGFISPAYAKGTGAPGWHLHFLSADKTKGGHLLATRLGKVSLEVDLTPRLTIALPIQGPFLKMDLGSDRSKALHVVEQGKK
ncbi:MAG: acetolactate decarboxylase [Proteobacteria bacterium]|nr:acetolactate decarboxylase [Pseudomonadota bacterium]MBU2470340.1 acetolactate decarboxylase [Pseudomonadota bacterium]MBU2518487.1 acetolactate decarboxylase [Pseudomonadota bacterium]